jgi:hypothetical protein
MLAIGFTERKNPALTDQARIAGALASRGLFPGMPVLFIRSNCGKVVYQSKKPNIVKRN